MKTRTLVVSLLAAVAMSIGLSGCTEVNEAMQQQAEETNKLAAEAQRQVGMPNLVNFTELRLLNKL